MSGFNPKQAEIQRVESVLGDSVICSTCGATLATYADKCSVALDVQCEGFLAVEAARTNKGSAQ